MLGYSLVLCGMRLTPDLSQQRHRVKEMGRAENVGALCEAVTLDLSFGELEL